MCFSRSGFFQLSRCPSYTWAHIKYPSSLCVCTCVYKYTPAHHPNTRKNREIYKTNPLSLPLPKHSLPRLQQALIMRKLEKNSTSNPSPHTHAGVEKNLGFTSCSRGIGTKCAYTSAYVHPHACAYTCICIHIHRHTYMHIHTYAHAHIHTYMHTHIHIHVHAYLYTDRKSQQRRLNASNNIIDAHTHPDTYACIHTYICIHTYVHNLQRMCRRCVC